MWLIIRDIDGAVVGTNYAVREPGAPEGHTAKEWHGAEPQLHNPEEGITSLDPTVDMPEYEDQVQAGRELDHLLDIATNEIAWLNDVIPQIDMMELAGLRSVLKRLAQENRQSLKAWRYVVSRLRGRRLPQA